VLNSNCIPNPTNKPFHKFKVNFASRSEIMVLGIPCNLKIYFIKTSTTSIALKVDLIGIK
jgi:hypothetical protein